jgi:transcriptional regulator with GAF, ATPase, and Fis domain
MRRSGMDLARMFAGMARKLGGQESVEQTVEDTARLATVGIPGCEQAGVFLVQGRRVYTAATTSSLVKACDDLQQELGEGPCLDVAWRDRVRRIDDMSAESRWPRFAQRASELGVGSMLSCRLATRRGRIGALNLYATRPSAFTAESAQLAMIFATHASLTLQAVRTESQLIAAMRTRLGIGQAIGMLVERHQIAENQAFEFLVRASQRLNEKLHKIAEAVVNARFDPVNPQE